MRSRDQLALALAWLILVLAVVAIATGGPSDVVRPGALDPAPAMADAGSAETDVPSTSGATTAPSVSSGPAVTAQTPRPVQTGAANPPRAGTYDYRETTDGEVSATMLRIADRGDGRYAEARENAINEVRWTDDGKFIVQTRFGPRFRCDWSPQIRELVLPLSAGKAWELEGSCADGSRIDVAFEGTSRVEGTRNVTVEGREIEAWVIRSEATVTFVSGPDSFSQRLSSDDRFAPAYGLYVRSTEKTKGPDPTTGRIRETTTVRELVSLSPS